METIQDHRDLDATREVANLGMVRPPLVYGAALGLGLILQFGWPLPFLPPVLAAPLGSFLVVVAVLLFSYATRTFQTAGTPVRGNQPTHVLVRTGPYRFSRNPIYLAFSVFLLGVASGVNSGWLVVTLLAAVALMAFVVIPREEVRSRLLGLQTLRAPLVIVPLYDGRERRATVDVGFDKAKGRRRFQMAAYWQLSHNAPIGRLVSNEPAVEVRLGPGEVFTLSGDRRGWSIMCEVGRLWITQAGDPKDYVLRPGQQFQVSTSGVVVMQGLPSGEAFLGA